MQTLPGRTRILVLLLLSLFAVPLLGWGSSALLSNHFEPRFRELAVVRLQRVSMADYEARGLSYARSCEELLSAPGMPAFGNDPCTAAASIRGLRWAALGTALMGVLILALVLGAKARAGNDRRRLGEVFGPLIRRVMLLLAVAGLAQGALLVYSVYVLEATLAGSVHLLSLLLVAVGALVACWTLVRAATGAMRAQALPVRAAALDPQAHAPLFDHVREIARRLGAEAPDHIVVGLEPNFFVTSSEVRTVDAGPPLQGRTLFLSLSLMRTLSVAELSGVIGHELGHFRGDDVAYTLRFAPLYARLGQALGQLAESSSGFIGLAKLPARVTLAFVLGEFATAERGVGRDRELLADQAGVEASDAAALARSLVKVSLYGLQWTGVQGALAQGLAAGRASANLSLELAARSREVAGRIDWDQAREVLGRSVQAHPVDTHPPLAGRLHALGVNLERLSPADIAVPTEASSSLIPQVEKLEEALSELETRWLTAMREASRKG